MKITFKEIENRFAFIYGFLGTMPILTLGELTVFSWLAVVSVLLFFFALFQRKAGFTSFCTPFLVMTLLSIITAFVCVFSTIPEIWKEYQATGFTWNVLYLCIFMYYSSKKRSSLPKYYLRGIYCASVVHLIWGYLQFILYNTMDIKLNDSVFINLLHMSEESLTQIKSGGIAISGFCSNAANMAPLLLIGYAFSSSIVLKILFLLCTFLSGSRVCVIALLSYIAISYIVKPNKSKIGKRMLMSIAGIIAVGFAFIVFSRKMTTIWSSISNTLGYFSRETLLTQSSAIIHLRYWTSIFEVGRFAGAGRVLFGFGMRCSGYPFECLYNQYAALNIGTWVVESDYIDQLWNLGLISLVIRYLWYGKFTKIAYHKDKRIFCILSAIYVGGIFYNLTFNWVFIMICCLFILMRFKNEDDSILMFDPRDDDRRIRNAG